MESIQITPISETVIDVKSERTGTYLVTTERIGVDQYGHRWHSIHTDIVFDNPPKVGDPVEVKSA